MQGEHVGTQSGAREPVSGAGDGSRPGRPQRPPANVLNGEFPVHAFPWDWARVGPSAYSRGTPFTGTRFGAPMAPPMAPSAADAPFSNHGGRGQDAPYPQWAGPRHAPWAPAAPASGLLPGGITMGGPAAGAAPGQFGGPPFPQGPPPLEFPWLLPGFSDAMAAMRGPPRRTPRSIPPAQTQTSIPREGDGGAWHGTTMPSPAQVQRSGSGSSQHSRSAPTSGRSPSDGSQGFRPPSQLPGQTFPDGLYAMEGGLGGGAARGPPFGPLGVAALGLGQGLGPPRSGSYAGVGGVEAMAVKREFHPPTPTAVRLQGQPWTSHTRWPHAGGGAGGDTGGDGGSGGNDDDTRDDDERGLTRSGEARRKHNERERSRWRRMSESVTRMRTALHELRDLDAHVRTEAQARARQALGVAGGGRGRWGWPGSPAAAAAAMRQAQLAAQYAAAGMHAAGGMGAVGAGGFGHTAPFAAGTAAPSSASPTSGSARTAWGGARAPWDVPPQPCLDAARAAVMMPGGATPGTTGPASGVAAPESSEAASVLAGLSDEVSSRAGKRRRTDGPRSRPRLEAGAAPDVRGALGPRARAAVSQINDSSTAPEVLEAVVDVVRALCDELREGGEARSEASCGGGDGREAGEAKRRAAVKTAMSRSAGEFLIHQTKTSPNWLLVSEQMDAFLLSLPLAELLQKLHRDATPGAAAHSLYAPHPGMALLLPFREEALVRHLLRLVPWLPLAVSRACSEAHVGVLRVTGEWTSAGGERRSQVWTVAVWSPMVSTAVVQLAGVGAAASQWVMVQQSQG